MPDLHTALEAAITSRLEVARAATPGPWTSENVYRLRPGCRCLSCDEDEPYGKAIHEIDAVGDDASPILRPVDADYIALHDPADAVRRYERDLKVLERHEPCYGCEPEMAHYNASPVCHRCGDVYPCEPMADLHAVYPEVTRDVD